MKQAYFFTFIMMFPLLMCGQNLLLNGGCENPGTGQTNNPDSWTNEYTDGIQCFQDGAFGAIVSEGSYAFVKNSFGIGDFFLSQVIDLASDESGTVFDYSIDYNTFAATTHQFSLNIEALSATDVFLEAIYFSGNITAGNTWQTLSGSTIAAPTGTQKLRVTLTWLEEATNDVILDNFSLIRNTTLNLEAFENTHEIKLFPNPTTDYIQISGLDDTEKYSIYNVVGAEVSTGSIATDGKIDVHNYADGLYLLKFEGGNTIKFLKE